MAVPVGHLEPTALSFVAFGTGVVLWFFIGAFFLARYLIRRHPLSLVLAGLPLGFLAANALYLGLLPGWLGAPFVWVGNLVASLLCWVLVREVHRLWKTPVPEEPPGLD